MNLSDLKNPSFAPKNRQAVRPAGSLFGPKGIPVPDSPELDRILAIPRRAPVDLNSSTSRAIVARETAKYRRDRSTPCDCRSINPDQDCITEFLPAQAVMLRELEMAGGGIGVIPVGGGKSMIDILAILALGLRRAKKEQGLLLVPAKLIAQLIDDYRLAAEHFVVPEIVIHKAGGDWVGYSPGQPILHVMTHNAISSPKDSDYIEGLRPAAIIIDEFHAFANLKSSRTIRASRYFREHGESTKFAGWTGSPTDKSITEMAHFFAWALKENSPLPIDDKYVEEVARCVDAVDRPCPAGALMRLVEDCDTGGNEIQRARTALGRRMAETRGVVITGTAEVRVTGADGKLTDELVRLEVVPRNVPPIPDIVREALDKVRGFERPDTLAGADFDDPIEDILMQAKYAREVACGMFYYADFPLGESRELIKEWYAAKSAWFSERRDKMYQGERFLDSLKLCENAARRAWGDLALGGIEEHERVVRDDEGDPLLDEDGNQVYEVVQVDNRHLPVWKSENWPRWRDIEDKVKPVQKAHRLSTFLVEDAAQWALENRGIVWYSMVELGEWIAEISGLPLMTGGPRAGEILMHEIRNNERSVIASVKSHGEGRNGFQHRFFMQYLINVISSNKVTEQLIGRTHRRGQRSSVIRTEVCLHTPELKKAFEQSLRRSDYVQGLLKQTQKLRMAIPA